VIQTAGSKALIEARPITGRTHQIRVHLTEAGLPVLGDQLYAPEAARREGTAVFPMALRSTYLSYRDPFQRRQVQIAAPVRQFLVSFGFDERAWEGSKESMSKGK